MLTLTILEAIPYLLKFFPHTKIMMTKATRDLAEIMLKDTAKLLQTELVQEYSIDTLSLYNLRFSKTFGC